MKTPHKHAETIKAWADGAEIECRQRQDQVIGLRVVEADVVVLMCCPVGRELGDVAVACVFKLA